VEVNEEGKPIKEKMVQTFTIHMCVYSRY
jgi:hypothetical protein